MDNKEIIAIILWAYKLGFDQAIEALQAASKTINTGQMEVKALELLAKKQSP